MSASLSLFVCRCVPRCVSGIIRAWRCLGGSHRIAKMRFALLLPFALVHLSFGLALYSSAASAKKVGRHPDQRSPRWLPVCSPPPPQGVLVVTVPCVGGIPGLPQRHRPPDACRVHGGLDCAGAYPALVSETVRQGPLLVSPF